MKLNKKYLLYLGRWQLSSIILFPVILVFGDKPLLATILANLIGGMIFWYVDKWIFSHKKIIKEIVSNE